MKQKWLGLIMAALLTIALTACSSSNEQIETTPTASEVEAGSGARLAIGVDEPDELDSYRMRWYWRWAPNGERPQMLLMEMTVTREPAARQALIVSDEEVIDWIQIGNVQWINMGTGWGRSEQSEQGLMSPFGESFAKPADFLGPLPESSYNQIGRETVNGIDARHYIIELTPAAIDALALGDVSGLEADLWVADDPALPAFIVRYTMRWTEAIPGAESAASAEWTYEVFDVNLPLTITLPPGAIEATLPDDVPIYAGATDLLVMASLATFTTEDDVDSVADFYRREMPAYGWNGLGDEGADGTRMLVWVKGERQVEVLITPVGQGAGVIITLSGQ